MDLKCRKTSCKHNKKYACDLKRIEITKNAECNCFAKSKEKGIDYSSQIFCDCESKNYPCLNVKNICICCQNQKCLFNCAKDCQANGITINDIANKPYCITYMKE